jgi:hypothetical protein
MLGEPGVSAGALGMSQLFTLTVMLDNRKCMW